MLRTLLLLCLAGAIGLAQAQDIRRDALPPEALETLALIAAGGPFPYRRDAIVFQNRERLLPKRPHGDYREYTVATPGVQHRGARRIVCAGQQPRTPDVCYYTRDHYRSFRKIVP